MSIDNPGNGIRLCLRSNCARLLQDVLRRLECNVLPDTPKLVTLKFDNDCGACGTKAPGGRSGLMVTGGTRPGLVSPMWPEIERIEGGHGRLRLPEERPPPEGPDMSLTSYPGGSAKRFYRALVRKADERFDRHLARLANEGGS